jgi:uncharacterized protein YcbK (DUF882 family)
MARLKGLRFGRTAAFVAVAAIATAAGVRPTQDAIAQGGTRSLTIFHAHTKEQETVTFKSFGSYNSAGLQKLNWLLRDWRSDEPTRMDPQLFDILWEVYRESGSSSPIHVVSAYRSPGTNAMLRRRSRGVAKNSQHMNGKALDFNLPDVSMARVRDIGLRIQSGGVGYYPRANNPWVHLDTGGVRHWPKVSRDHLVRIFPDERTVHIPRDGKPLAGFEAARSIIEARGGSVSSGYIDIAEGRATGKSLFQILFGGGEGDDDGDVASARGKKGGRTAVAARSQRNTQTAAIAPDQGSEGGSALAFFSQNATSTNSRPETPAALASIRNRPATRPTPLPEPQDAQPKAAEQPKAEPPKTEPPKREEPAKIELAALPPKAAPKKPEDEADGRWVNVPLPQRRPSGLQSGPVLVNVPLPQARPTTLLASAVPSSDEEKAEKPLEPAKPVQVASAGRAVAIPLPQSRPQGLPSAITVGLRTSAPAEPTPQPSAITAYAPTPAAQARIVPAAPNTAPKVDKQGMNSLMSQIATASSPARGARVAPASVAAVAEVKTVTGRFEPNAQPRAETGFSGSAIRPLANQGFKRQD